MASRDPKAAPVSPIHAEKLRASMAKVREAKGVQKKMTPDEQLAEALSKFYDDPLGYVMFCFPWDRNESIQQVKLAPQYRKRFPNCEYGPDVWACEFLDELGVEIKKRKFDGKTAVQPIAFTTASGHGIGKSVLVAWLIKFIADTRPFSKGVVTATTAEQLKTKTWAELGKWHKMSLTEHWFDYNTGRGALSLTHKKYPEQWKCNAQTSKEENSESFAGLHAANSTPYYIFDEASGVPDKIFEVREGGTTDGEPMIFDFGNPTKNSGRFFENTVGSRSHRFIVKQIDSRKVAITNKTRIQEWVDDYGEDSDFVKVRVRGVFPRAGTSQFIPTADVEMAMRREIVPDRSAPLIIGVDIARMGNDETVILPRMGYDARSWPIVRLQGHDTVQVEGRIIQMIHEFRRLGIEPAGIFVDMGNTGAAVVDHLRHWGYSVSGIWFGGSPIDKLTYRFRVDEMWGRIRDAVKERLVLPPPLSKDGEDLKGQLTKREFGYTTLGNKIQLESKKDMKERLGSDGGSPDIADALALTFAVEVSNVAPHAGLPKIGGQVLSDYDPLNFTF